MGYGPVKAFTVTMISGATLLTVPVDLGTSYDAYLIGVPSMPSGTDVYIQGSDAVDGTYRRIYFNASTSTPSAVQIASSVSNAIVPINAKLPQFVKIELSTAATASTYVFKIFGHN